MNETVNDCAGEDQDNHSEPGCSARDESGLFVSNESWDLSVKGYARDDSTPCVETLSSPDRPRHALPNEAGTASSVAPHPLDKIVAAIGTILRRFHNGKINVFIMVGLISLVRLVHNGYIIPWWDTANAGPPRKPSEISMRSRADSVGHYGATAALR